MMTVPAVTWWKRNCSYSKKLLISSHTLNNVYKLESLILLLSSTVGVW